MSEDRHYDVSIDAGSTFPSTEYLILHRSGELVPAGPAEPIASGGAGVVYRGQAATTHIDVAIKLLSPRKDLIEYVDSDAFRGTFAREITILAGITHTRIAKILDGGTSPLNGEAVPYYAMEFVDGDRFGEFIQNAQLSGLDFLALVDQVLDALEYLHARGIMHADLKGDNVLVRQQYDQLDVKVLDLGVAKVLKPPEDQADSSASGGAEAKVAENTASRSAATASTGSTGANTDQDEAPDGPSVTYFYSTKKITRPEWRPRLGKALTRDELLEMFPGHDLFAVGVLIKEALDAPGMRERLVTALGRSGVEAMSVVKERLLAPLESQYYDGVRRLRSDWEKLHPRYLSPLGVAELAVGAEAATSVATPNGRVSLTERALDVVNHQSMQRLRNIPQLELVQLLYPGATHTRLLHSISTFDSTRRYVSHLLRDPTFRLMVEPDEVTALLLSALCHDIGHYPLSHMFEDWSHHEAQTGGERSVPTDDDLFPAFLDPEFAAQSPFSEFATVIREETESGPPLHEYLFGEGRFSQGVADALRGLRDLQSASHRLLRGVLDSPIDTDKFAYLTDDSTMTGVRYGLGIDFDALLGSLRAPRLTDIPDDRRPLIAINDKGLPAAEQMVLGRYWMLRRVYWHHTNRAVMAMVKFVIAQLLRAGRLDMVDYYRATFFGGPKDGLRYLSDAFAAAIADGLVNEEGAEVCNPIAGLQHGARLIYKRILTVAKGDPGVHGEIFDRLASRRPDAVLDAANVARTEISEFLGESIRSGDVLLDVPLKERGRAKTRVLVYLAKGESEPKDLTEASPVVSSLAPEYDTHVRKARLYVHPELRSKLDARGLPDLRTALLDALATA